MIRLGGKQISLDQLQQEMLSAGLDVSNGLGTIGDWVFPYDANQNPVEFNNTVTAQNVINAHVAMRVVTNDELCIMYEDANNKNDHATMQNIVAMSQGLIARSKVPINSNISTH